MRNKTELEERWRDIFNSFKERMPTQKSLYLNPKRNIKFDFTVSWSSHLATLGKFEYILNNNVKLFKEYLKESILVYQELFDAYDNGKPVDGSYVTMLCYHELFEALATGDIELAKGFASRLGGREIIEKDNDHPFVIAFGYTLKYFVEDANDTLKKSWLQKLLSHCKNDKMFTNFLGYCTVFEAILERDLTKAHQGFREIVEGHEAECKGKGDRHFKGLSDEDICVWGIGLVNLAIHYGLNIEINNPLIPKELLT